MCMSIEDKVLPLRVIWPSDIFSRPAIILSNVDFPQPDGPTITVKERLFIERDISLITLICQKIYLTNLFVFQPFNQCSYTNLNKKDAYAER